MFQEILSDPLKLAMAIVLIILEVPAVIVLVLMWRKACRNAKKLKRKMGGAE